MATIRCGEIAFENIQAVLFDKDGTLANVERYLCLLGQLRADFVAIGVDEGECCSSLGDEVASQLLAAFGQGNGWINPSGLMAVGSREYNEVAAAAYVVATGKVGWGVALAQVKAAFCKADAALPLKVAETPLLSGVAPLLSALASAEVALGIVSSDLHQEVEAFVDYYSCRDISWYCGAGAEYLPKTHPDFLNFACESMGVSPLSTLVVGDSASDLALAQQGSAGFVAMLGGWSCLPVIEGVDIGGLEIDPSECVGWDGDGLVLSGHKDSDQGGGRYGTDLKIATIRSLEAVEVFK